MSSISDKLRQDIENQLKGGRSLEGGTRVPYYKVDNDGESHQFRVLPGTFGESKELWFLGVAQHWVKKGSNRIPLYCPRMEDSRCPFCDEMESFRDKESELKEALKSKEVKNDKNKYREIEGELKVIAKIISYTAPRSSYMMNVLDRDDSSVKVYSAPKTVFAKIMSHFSEDGPEIFDVNEGHDFRIKKKRKGRSVEYPVELVPKVTPVKPTESAIQDVLDKRHEIEALIKYEDASKLKDYVKDGIESVISGGSDDDDDYQSDSPSRESEDDSEGTTRRHVSDDRESRDERHSQHHHRDHEDTGHSVRRSSDRGDDDEVPMQHESDTVDLPPPRKTSSLLSKMSRLRDDD